MLRDCLSVDGKVVVLTGGLGQLGRQFTSALVDRGARVAIFDAAVSDQRVAVSQRPELPEDRVLFRAVDVTVRSSLEAGLQALNERWGVPHALINNAALDSPPSAPARETGPVEGYPEDCWDKIMAVNVKGVFQGCQVVGGQMATEGRGSIVNICSTYGLLSPDQRVYDYLRAEGRSFFKPVAYSVSKSALPNLTRYLATYWASTNVRVNTLTFGGVFNHQDERFLKAYTARVPLGRMAREDEYNGAIIFLVSDASSYMTGANLVIDGGWTAW